MSTTGQTVIEGFDGTFKACEDRTDICGYACCQFGKLGNWIFSLPGEIEKAATKNLSFDHLTIEHIPGEDGSKITCNRPCTEGEFKPMDCSWYPLYPANLDATMFIVADNRKCPIPHRELVELAVTVGKQARGWETLHPGTMVEIVKAAKGFKAYTPFKYRIYVDGTITGLSEAQMKELEPTVMLPNEYSPEWKSIVLVDRSAYTRTTALKE